MAVKGRKEREAIIRRMKMVVAEAEAKGAEKVKAAEKPKDESANELQDGGKITVQTLDEQKHVNMLLDILRGVNEQDKLAITMTIATFHPYCNKENAVDPRCIKAMEESAKQQAQEEPENELQDDSKTTKEPKAYKDTPPLEVSPVMLRKRVDELSFDDVDTIENGFYYINGFLALAQRIGDEDSTGYTKEAPEDFYWLVDEARQRLDKIRVLLGFLYED